VRRLALLALGTLALAVAAASCSSAETLTCPAPASASLCPSLDGVTSFCTWAEWGCARVASCGGYYLLVDEGTDARFTYYYAAATGAFVATVREAPGGGVASCLAGPAQFQPPQGCSEDTLAECGPPPRDGGGIFAIDAGTDAQFTAPSPSGSPSAQPLAAPPPRIRP
jgi:hypothetical protein